MTDEMQSAKDDFAELRRHLPNVPLEQLSAEQLADLQRVVGSVRDAIENQLRARMKSESETE